MSEVDYDAVLAQRSADFLLAHGREPSMNDISADASWHRLYNEKKHAERAAAAQLDGGCSVYIVRRRRYCSNAAGDGLGGLCSEHHAQSEGIAPLAPLEMEAFCGRGKRNLKRRMKRMTNPSCAQFQASTQPPDWTNVYADLTLPMLLDIGCAKGRFLANIATSEEFAKHFGPHNFCGVEIFAPLVEAANHWRDQEKLKNLHYIAGNANTSMDSLFAQLPAPLRITKICVQFPDPWQQDNISKRVLTPALAAQLARLLPVGEGQLYVVSDMPWLAHDMVATVLATQAFELDPLHVASASIASEQLPTSEAENHPSTVMRGAAEAPAELEVDAECSSGATTPRDDEQEATASVIASDLPPSMTRRPYFAPTERDKVCEMKWRPAYRYLFRRNHVSLP